MRQSDSDRRRGSACQADNQHPGQVDMTEGSRPAGLFGRHQSKGRESAQGNQPAAAGCDRYRLDR